MKRLLLIAAAAAAVSGVFAAATLRAEDDFYMNLYRRGVADAQAKNHARAVSELRIAAFGLIDQVTEYETAQILVCVSANALGRQEEAAAAAEKVLFAERIQPVYARLAIDPEAKRAFEALLPKLVTAEKLRRVPTFQNFAATAIATAPSKGTKPVMTTVQTPTVPAPVTPAPTPSTSSAATKPGTVVPAPLAGGIDKAKNAHALWVSGDLANAVKAAKEAIELDFGSGPAREVLGNVAAIERRWSDVVEHLSIAWTSQRLTEDEKGKLFIGLVNLGRRADATTMRNTLAKSTLASPDVDRAVKTLDGDRRAAATPATPPPPPPQSPQPAMTTAAMTTPAPQPKTSQPAPQPAARTMTTASATNAPRTPPATSNAESSPFVSASKHAPSNSPATLDTATVIADANRLLAQGKIVAARDLFVRVAQTTGLRRDLMLDAAKGLNQTSAWRESSAAYAKAGTLQAGEEVHMFNEAVNRYELGDYAAAKQLLARALPRLPQSRELTYYRGRIETAR